MNTIQDAYIVSAIRTPVGKAKKGSFNLTRPDDLLAHLLKDLATENPWLREESISDVITGCAMPEGEQGINIARVSTLLAGYADTVPGMTINRFCSSGLQAIAMAADRIRLGEADIMIASGTESMSMVPMMGNKLATNPAIFNDENVAIAYGMGITAEKVAEKWDISREDQDAFALQSHQRAVRAIENGQFKEEIRPFTVRKQSADLASREITQIEQVIEHDEGPRADTSPEALAKLRPAFKATGSVTAGNASQTSDGAGALLLVSEKILKRYDLKPLGRFVSFSVAGVPPEIMGIGPIKAIPQALQLAGLKASDLDWIELNEAFAAQTLAVMRDLNLDTAKTNPLGGAIALGHPLGATGAIRASTLLHGLKRTNGRYGMVTMCIGTGMGAAGIFERL